MSGALSNAGTDRRLVGALQWCNPVRDSRVEAGRMQPRSANSLLAGLFVLVARGHSFCLPMPEKTHRSRSSSGDHCI